MTLESPVKPRLSIIVPVLNEQEQLPPFCANLREQTGVVFEILFADGGSQDRTLSILKDFAAEAPFTVRCIASEVGRGRQMNVAARIATGEYLLFLHVDSLFPESDALQRALDFYCQSKTDNSLPMAAFFRLSFDLAAEQRSWRWFFYEQKARLPLADSTLGDQGFLMSADVFNKIGPFDERLRYLEDVRFSRKLAAVGAWIPLPVDIQTSARRFSSEGFYPRQVINALIMAFNDAGLDELLYLFPQLYKEQKDAQVITLSPFFSAIGAWIRGQNWRQQLIFWKKIGRYVHGMAWQIPFAVNAKRAWKRHASEVPFPQKGYQLFHRWTNHTFGWYITAVLVWLWFTGSRFMEKRTTR